MRLDNPIHNHKFKNFVDITTYSEVKNEYKNNRKISLKSLEKHFVNKDYSSFEKELKKIIFETEKDIKITVSEKKYLDFFFLKLKKYFNFYKDYNVNSKKIKNVIFDDLYKYGYHITNIDTKKIFNSEIKKKYEILKNRKDWTPPPGTHDRWIELSKKTTKNIDRIFRKAGLIKASEAYLSKKLRVTRVRLTVHRPTDKAWRQFLYDCKKITRHTGIHIDPLEGVTKSMIYLNEVGLENGPTQYLPKSNRFTYPPLQNLFARTIVAGSRCHNKTSRRVIFRLPKQLRITTDFGRLIKDNSPLAKYLDKKMVKFTSDKGNTLIFDPGAGIHNGAIVKKGERIALMVVIDSI